MRDENEIQAVKDKAIEHAGKMINEKMEDALGCLDKSYIEWCRVNEETATKHFHFKVPVTLDLTMMYGKVVVGAGIRFGVNFSDSTEPEAAIPYPELPGLEKRS